MRLVPGSSGPDSYQPFKENGCLRKERESRKIERYNMKNKKELCGINPFSTLEIAHFIRNALTKIYLALLYLPKIANINEIQDILVGLQENTIVVMQLLCRTMPLPTF